MADFLQGEPESSGIGKLVLDWNDDWLTIVRAATFNLISYLV